LVKNYHQLSIIGQKNIKERNELLKYKDTLEAHLLESYEGSVKSNMDGNYVEVFVNPSKKEMKDAANSEFNTMKPYVRFIALYGKEKLYIWRANCNHHVIDTELGLNTNSTNSLWGVAEFKNGILSFISSDDAALSKSFPKFRDKWKNKDDWTKQFFGGKKLLTGEK
jgi:hypothetical protein